MGNEILQISKELLKASFLSICWRISRY